MNWDERQDWIKKFKKSIEVRTSLERRQCVPCPTGQEFVELWRAALDACEAGFLNPHKVGRPLKDTLYRASMPCPSQAHTRTQILNEVMDE
jgi:hypothetical protein